MHQQLQPAYVLHRRPFRDSSELVDVLTHEQGRQTLVARGVSRRRRGGSLGALLQPFKPLLVSFRGRGELPTLTGVESAGALASLRGDALLGGMYLNELLLRLLPRHAIHGDLFVAYGNAVADLADLSHGIAMEPILRRFEFELLEELGYGVDLVREAGSDRPLEPGERYRLVPEQGFYRQQGVAEGSDESYRGDALIAIAGGDFENGSAATAKRLIRELLHPHLGSVPLRSRRMFAASRRAVSVGVSG